MILLLSMALQQELQIDLRQKFPEVRVTVRGPKERGPEVVRVLHWALEARGGTFEGGWADVSLDSTSPENGRMTAELSLIEPGLYQIVLGSSSVMVAVSRSELKNWKDDLKTLRECVRRLELIAGTVDQAKDPSANQVAEIRRRLQQERGRISRVKAPFTASMKALEVAVDRLYYSRPLLRLPAPAAGEPVPGYGPQAKEKEEAAGPTAVQDVQALRDVIAREGALVLVDELQFLMGPDAGTPGTLRVLRWRDRAKALGALREGREALGDFPELESLLKDAQDGRDSEGIAARIPALREKICKP